MAVIDTVNTAYYLQKTSGNKEKTKKTNPFLGTTFDSYLQHQSYYTGCFYSANKNSFNRETGSIWLILILKTFCCKDNYSWKNTHIYSILIIH